jgi:hypothetical protein
MPRPAVRWRPNKSPGDIMRRLAFATMLICLHTMCAAAEPEDTPATRRQAAERYAQANDLPKMLADVSDAMSQTLPAEKRAEFKALMTQYVRVDVLQEAMLISMTRHFTTRELNALAAFYGSEEGKSAMAKFGLYMTDVMPMIEAEMKHAVEASRADKAKTPGT